MKLFNRAMSAPSATGQPAAQDAALLQEKADVLGRSILVMLHFLKTFAQEDIKEINVDRYKSMLDDLTDHFKSMEKPKKVELHFERQKDSILAFIDRQNGYLKDREHELRDIIDLLTKAMANLNVENRDFYQRVYDQGEKIIEITRLDDIKKIKTALKQEVEQMRATVDHKLDQERRQMSLLSRQVESLRQELEQAKAKSMIDPLTGVNNRAALDDYLADMIERNEVMNGEVALLLLDIDDFKAVNDNFGHPIGDRVLIAFAHKCRCAIRGDDFLARYGGEEFAIVLPGANLRNALKKARHICAIVDAARYTVDDCQSADHLSITVSIGVSAFKKGDGVQSLIDRADKALYEAKQGGKNRAAARKS